LSTSSTSVEKFFAAIIPHAGKFVQKIFGQGMKIFLTFMVKKFSGADFGGRKIFVTDYYTCHACIKIFVTSFS